MEYSRFLWLAALLAAFAGSEAFNCYDCEWREIAGVDTGDDDCLKIASTTDVSRSSNCKYCITKTIDSFGHNWIERTCSTENSCRDAEEEETWEDEIYDVKKRCCNTAKCNKETFEPDSGSAGLHLSGSLLAAVLISLLVNLRH